MIDWPMLEWEKQKMDLDCGLTVNCVSTTLPLQFEKAGVGVDPGRNFAIAAITRFGRVNIYYGYLHIKKGWSYAQDGIMAYELMKEGGRAKLTPCVIEGAAHSLNVGQANLAYIRMGFYLGAYHMGYDVKMKAINTIRKMATGHGRKAMWELLPTLNDNAADALGCCLYAVGYKHKEGDE